jgi:hypothetical protein
LVCCQARDGFDKNPYQLILPDFLPATTTKAPLLCPGQTLFFETEGSIRPILLAQTRDLVIISIVYKLWNTPVSS